MPKSNFKQELFSQFALIGKALSNANRLELLEFLAQGERSVEPLAKKSGLSMANASQHLQVLRQAGLVVARKKGQNVFYRLADESVVELMRLLRRIGESNLAEVDRLIQSYLKVKDELEPISAQELLERAGEGLVTVLDVRPPDEFEAGRVPGAVNVPVKELEKYLETLEPGREIIAYCRGPYCVLSFDAVKELRKRGFKARRLEEGFPEWKSSGLPVESGSEE